MYTTNLDQFKSQQRELHRQASQFRLTKSLLESSRTGARRTSPLGRLLAQTVQSSKNRNNSGS